MVVADVDDDGWNMNLTVFVCPTTLRMFRSNLCTFSAFMDLTNEQGNANRPLMDQNVTVHVSSQTG